MTGLLSAGSGHFPPSLPHRTTAAARQGSAQNGTFRRAIDVGAGTIVRSFGAVGAHRREPVVVRTERGGPDVALLRIASPHRAGHRAGVAGRSRPTPPLSWGAPAGGSTCGDAQPPGEWWRSGCWSVAVSIRGAPGTARARTGWLRRRWQDAQEGGSGRRRRARPHVVASRCRRRRGIETRHAVTVFAALSHPARR